MKFGSTVSDKITGFSGIVIGKSSYITGCDQYLIQPKIKDGSFVEGRWIDEGRLELVEENSIEPQSVMSDENGCDIPAPMK